jgi:hypothetical protein
MLVRGGLVSRNYGYYLLSMIQIEAGNRKLRLKETRSHPDVDHQTAAYEVAPERKCKLPQGFDI